MTEPNDTVPEPQDFSPSPVTLRRRSRWVRPLAITGVLLGGVALAAGGLAATAGADGAGWRDGMRLAFMQRAVTRALDSVGASSAQEAKIHDIVAAKFVELGPNPQERAAMRKQALDLLAAPAIDRAAVEKMRLEAVAKFDAKSKAVVAAALDVASELTPEQRAKLAAHLEAMADRGPPGPGMGGPWGHGGRWGHGPMWGGPGGAPDDGPDDGRDGGPNRGPGKD